MGRYVPTTIAYQSSGLVKDKDAFILSDDAYQNLENMYLWRGRLRRRPGYDLLGRLRRDIVDESIPDFFKFNFYHLSDLLSSYRANEPNASLVKGSVSITFDPGGANETTFTDNSLGGFTRTAGVAYDLYPEQTITAITQAASAVITLSAPHEFVGTDKVYIQDVSGMTEINDTVGTITAAGASTITVNVNSSAFSTYTSGGTVNGSFINYDTGEISLTFAAGSVPAGGIFVHADYSYYPCLPVMGLPNKELADINAEQTVAFDTIYAYNFNNTTSQFQELPSTTATTWTGTDSDFFYGITYWRTSDSAQYYWVTNFSGVGGDPIRVYDGVDWYTFAPTTSGADEMHQCRMLIPYKGHLVALNTFEGATLAASNHFPQRARWSQSGAPLSSVAAGVAPTALQEWRSDIKGRGGYVDAPTNEHIVSAEFIRDMLVVGFESSTWALRYTGNQLLPFVWERINQELGCESTFSTVAFDQGVLSIGDKSINSCNGNSVERIDQNIPDEVFNIHNSVDPTSQISDGPLRVHGKRDFYEEIVYWTFPDASTASKFPDRVLVFNYSNQSWAIFTDSFTAFGEYQRFNDITWADLSDVAWEDANFSWVTAKLQSQFPNIIAGNQQGFVLNLNQKVSNSPSLYIANITGGTGAARLTVVDHNLQTDEFVEVASIIGTGADELNNRIFRVSRIDSDTIDLYEKPRTAITAITKATNAVVTAPGHTFSVGQHFYIDKITAGMTEMSGLNGIVTATSSNTITINIDSSGFTTYTSGGYIQNLDASYVPAVAVSRTYMGCGTLTRVMGFNARSKKFNFLQGGEKVSLAYIDFLANVTSRGEISCDIFNDYDDANSINDVEDSFFNNTLSTQIEQFSNPGKAKEFHRLYCNTDGQFFEYNLTLDDAQIQTPGIVDSDVLIDAIIVWATNAGRLAN